MYAAVDLGSNSFRLHIGELIDGHIRIVHSARAPVRLAAGLDGDNILGQAAIARALACLQTFREVLSRYRCHAVRVVATNTLRVARNAAQVLVLAEQALGYPIEVISGSEEARLIYLGVQSALAPDDAPRLVIDIGGGSTEVIAGSGAHIGVVHSFGLGTQSQFDRFFSRGLIDASCFDAALTHARRAFQTEAAPFRAHGWDIVYGSSGSLRAIAAAGALPGTSTGAAGASLTLAAMLALRQRLLDIGRIDAICLDNLAPERVPVMVGALTVLLAAMQEFGFTHIEAVDAGLRMGVLAGMVAPSRLTAA